MHKETINTQPKFSIVMPVYNVKKYLNESVESVLNQTYRNLELIIVDDGSTDGCYEICENYRKLDPRCKVIHQENKGLLLARRAGIKVAAGDYLINVDSDDKCSLSMLGELAAIINNKAPDMIIYNYSKLNDNGEVTNIEPLFQEEIIPLNRTWIVQTFVSKVVLNMMWIKCTKLSLVDVDADYSMYGRLNMAEDQLQSAALFENVNNVFYYNKPLYLYRDNGDSITRKQTPKLLIDSLKAKSRVMDMLRQLQVEENIYDKFFENYYRTLNHYIVKNISTFENYKSYKTFVSEAQSYDVGGLYAAKSLDKLVYRILYSNNYSAIRVLGCIYNLIKNK